MVSTYRYFFSLGVLLIRLEFSLFILLFSFDHHRRDEDTYFEQHVNGQRDHKHTEGIGEGVMIAPNTMIPIAACLRNLRMNCGVTIPILVRK